MDPFNLASAVVPVTGAASGIGLAVCRQLRARGARPLLLDLDPARLEAALQEVYPDLPDRARHGYPLDVSDSGAVDACFARIDAEHGGATHAVANAGTGMRANALEITDAQWERVLAVNLSGAMYFCRAAARRLVERKGGAIVVTASIAGLLARENSIGYASSKAAAINMTRALAIDLGPHGVRANAVAPGIIDTPMQQKNPPERVQAAAGRAVLGRLGSADEVASVIVFLLSDQASYVTGQAIVVDGGIMAKYA